MRSGPSEKSLRPVTVRVYTRYTPGRVYARVQVVGEAFLARGARVELILFSLRSQGVCGKKVVRLGKSGEVFFATGKVPFGCCTFKATLISRSGERFEAEVLYEKSPGDLPWMGSAEGVSRRVVGPWTPLECRREGAGYTVSCWGRDYRMDGKGLLAGAKAVGADLLSGALGPVARVGGKPVRWRKGTIRILANGPDQVILLQEFTSPIGLTVSARTEVDFDGMLRIDWKVSSQRIARLEELFLEAPVRAPHARYVYHFPGRWGGARNVGELPRKGLSLPFRPFLWVGDEDRGLSVFCESERNRFVKDPNRMTEVVRKQGTAILRMRLVDLPVKLLPGVRSERAFTGYGEEDLKPFVPGGGVTRELRYSVGVQATPVKPVVADAWAQRIVCIGQGTPGFSPRMKVSAGLLDRLVSAGVRAVVLFEHWADAEGYTRTPHGDAVRRIVAACHRRGLKVLLYFGFLISDIADEWRDFGKDSVVLPKGGYPIFAYRPQPHQAAWRVCLNSAWQDFLADGMARAMDEFEVDGVYLDGTEYPFGCCNTEHGCGTVRRDGSIAPTYPLFGVRSAMRRIHEIVRSRNPEGLINVHNSTCMTIPTLGWATSYWDGEQFQGVGKGADVAGLLPLDAFRAEFMGRQWGVPAEFLHAGSAYTYRQAWAFTLLHDIPVRPHSPGEDLDLIGSIWRAMDAFGRERAEWLPYWCNQGFVKCHPASVHASLYRHEANGILAVVSNMGARTTGVRVTLNGPRLGLGQDATKAMDALRGRSLPVSKGEIRLRLKPLEWRLIWLRNR